MNTEKYLGKCTICNNDLHKKLLLIDKPDRFEISVGISEVAYERIWAECNVCGLATNLLPSDSDLKLKKVRNSYYEVDLLGASVTDKYNLIMQMPPEKSDNAGRVDRILQFIEFWQPTTAEVFKVLDIGAGTGVFLSRLMDKVNFNLSCVGIEPDPIAAKHLIKLEKFQVFEAMFVGQESLRDFNLITLNKVLEHIDQPIDFLKKISASINKKNGLVYIEVPDKLTASLRPNTDNILGTMHHHLYDPKSLISVINSSGLEVLSMSRVLEPSGKITIFAFASMYDSMVCKF